MLACLSSIDHKILGYRTTKIILFLMKKLVETWFLRINDNERKAILLKKPCDTEFKSLNFKRKNISDMS